MAEKYYVEVDDYGTTYWFAGSGAERKLHRLDGPAVEYTTGSRAWFQNGQWHRLDGPAVEYADVFRAWYQNGLRHRLDGPAVEYADGSREWWLNDVQHTEESWRAAMQPVVEMTIAEIEAALGKRIKIVK
jgi:hypothetical protein